MVALIAQTNEECPTQWTVHIYIMHYTISSNYEALLQLWEKSLDFVRETRARA